MINVNHEYWVDSSTEDENGNLIGDDNNNGTYDAPLRTIAEAIKRCKRQGEKADD